MYVLVKNWKKKTLDFLIESHNLPRKTLIALYSAGCPRPPSRSGAGENASVVHLLETASKIP